MATTEESARAEGGEPESGPVHGGKLVARALADRGVSKLFTLSGGHLFSIYDGCVAEGIDLIDTRHEQAAAWAAEGYAKATRKPGIAALTAGPGVTNGMSAMAGAKFNRSPLVVLGGRAPEMRWGSGSLQEIDHLPFVSPLTKSAETVKETGDCGAATARAIDTALHGPTGPTYVDYPLDVVFMEGEGELEPKPTFAPTEADGVEEAAAALGGAERPVIMAGTGVYWSHGEGELQQLAEELGIPVFLNGMGRGCLPADHDLCFSSRPRPGPQGRRRRRRGRRPARFPPRLRRLVRRGDEDHLARRGAERADREPQARVRAGRRDRGDAGGAADARRSAPAPRATGPAPWVASLRETEDEKRAGEADELNDDRAPLHPLRIYGELAQMLDRDAIVIGDGGDFVSYAGRVVNTYEPGCWMDPGPYGCLGAGPGQAIGAKTAFPDRQVVCLLGDGAFGFSGLEFDTMMRHDLPVVGIIGNNGIWALEYHPMRFLYGYEVAASLRPATRYDEVVKALGGHGELVRHPSELQPALERAFASGKPALVNVLTDPEVVYPRKAVLA